jgi:hypothetical protein
MKRFYEHSVISVPYNFLVKKERWLIVIFMALSFAQLWLTKYVPSLDGPQHLYTASVINELLKGNEFFGEFFRMNDVLVGYWTGHFFLSLFKFFLPAWLAEKVFLTGYVLGMFFAFRYLVRSIAPRKDNLLVYMIFPFIFHNYLVLGYYAFSIAVIFFFWAFGYWIRKKDSFGWKEILVFGSIVLGIFLSHALVFAFFAAAFLIYFAATGIFGLLGGKDGKRKAGSWRGLFLQALRILLAVTPAVVCWAIYIRAVMGINPTITAAAYYKMELVKFILRIRQLVGFHHEMETPAYIALFILLAVLCLAALYDFIRRRLNGEGQWRELFNHRYAWIYVSLFFLLSYFLMPDRISAGSLTHRFGLFFFLALIIFLVSHPTPKWLQMTALLVVLLVMGSTRLIHYSFLTKLNRDVMEIKEMEAFMEDGSTVYSLNSSNNWIHRHFQLYAADEKKLVHLRNPQCAGQFPVRWNEQTLPECYAGDSWVKPDRAPDISGQGHRKLQIDYISVFYQKQFWESEEEEAWQEVLLQHYELVMTTSRELGALYQKKHR